MIQRCMPLLVLFLTLQASTSFAATRAYDSSHANGRPGAFVFLDSKMTSTNAVPGSSPHMSLPGAGPDPGEAAAWARWR